MMVPILAATAGLEGWWQFMPAEQQGAAVIVVRFRRGGHADIMCRYGAVFIFDLLEGLVARGDVAAATDGARAAVRALELKHAARRDAEARRALSCEPQPGSSPVGGYAGEAAGGAPHTFPSVEGAGHSPSAVTPAGVADLAPAGGPIPGAAP